jgi:DNA-binding CsgD family transcriptional regulator
VGARQAESLSDEDWQLVTRFVDRVMVEDAAYPTVVMEALADIFGWSHCDFWLNDRHGRIHHPVTSVGQGFVREFQSSLHSFDFLNARSVGIERAVDAVVITEDDLMTQEEFEESEYGRFLERYGFRYEVAVYLKGRDRLIGSIGLFRREDEGPFTARDKLVLRHIAPVISRILEMNSDFDKAAGMRLNLRHFADLSDTGLIFFGEEFHVQYANQVAKQICGQLGPLARDRGTQSGDESGEDAGVVRAFLRNVFGGNPLSWVMGYEKSFVLPDYSSVELRLSPAPARLSYNRDQRMFMVTMRVSHVPVSQAVAEDTSCGKLTFRKLEVVSAVVDGLSNQEIADKLFISVSAVKKHLREIFRAEGVNSRLELVHKVLMAQQH